MTKIDELINWFNGQAKVLVALSGGVDSALVAYAAHKSLGNSAIAVTADYKTLAHEELESAEKICSEIGIKHIMIQYNELENPKFTKDEIREDAKKVGLSVYDRPSNSCLASRIPWGQEVTVERLARIEMGEIMVKHFFGVRQVRVRDFNGTAKIEVGREEICLLSDQTKLSKLIENLKRIGFISVIVDPEGYRPGKLNVIVD